MGKIKQALICWNEENGYDPCQTSGWDYRNKKALPTIKKIGKSYKQHRTLINNIIKGDTK
jgi:hypothetical protein